jgi:fructose-1,6-bisphosphatase/inositol monophosphatase family enzyme
MDVNLHEFQEFLKLLAFQAGAVALELRGKVSDLGKDIVGPDGRRNHERSRARRAMTVVDLAIQELVLTGISKRFPQITLVRAEEQTNTARILNDRASRYCFVLDPLDGTLTYLEGGDTFAILGGLIDRDRFVAAVLYYPVGNVLYSAVFGEGAICERDGERRHLKVRRDYPDKVIEVNDRVLSLSGAGEALGQSGFTVRQVRDAATAILRAVEGRSFGYMCYTRNLQAGLSVSDWAGSELRYPPETPSRVPTFMVLAGMKNEIVDALEGASSRPRGPQA